MRRKRVLALAATGALALIAPSTVQAHISLHPNTIPAGASATVDVRVPGEQQGAYVTKVDMRFPGGFLRADYESVPGWSTKVIEAKPAAPVVVEGETINSEVEQVVWTWTGPQGRVNNGQFVSFPLSLVVPSDATGKALEFKTVQSYSNGQVVHWTDPSLQAEHPSPRINVTARGGPIQEVAGGEAGPAAGQAAGSEVLGGAAPHRAGAASSNSSSTEDLAIAALIVGVVGLVAALAALVAWRRKTAS
jgi:uncharacterized protein YcnI